jgi:TRAP-type C4-dicarboxylate transport system substrate-binding protein
MMRTLDHANAQEARCMITKHIVPALLLGASLLLAHTAPLAQPKPIELRWTSGAPPKGNPWVMQVERFAKDVEEESKGTVKISPFFASQLGSEQDTVQQVARGRIDMGGFSAGSSALVVPEVALLLMPFYFRNAAELDCVLDTVMTKPVTEAFAKKGVQFMSWGEVGTVELWGRKPLMMPADLNGIKAAIYANKTQSLFFTSQGANVNPLGLPEWIPAFQTGAVDVVMTPITFALPSGLTKVAPVVSKLSVYDAPGLNLMNKAVWDKLPKEQQEALVRASARNPPVKQRAEVRDFEKVLYGMFEKGGGQVSEGMPAQRDAWRKAMEPVYPQIVKETGGDAAAFYATMEAGRKACAK